jgi:hypothetical protein
MNRAPLRFASSLLLAGALLAAGACVRSTVGPTIFTPHYALETSPAEIQTAPPCAKIHGVVVVDGRVDKRVVGRRVRERGGEESSISVDQGVEAWLRSGADQILTYASVARGPAAPESAGDLHLTLASIAITESTYVQSELEGKVVVDAALERDGKEVWSNRFDGTAKNWGTPGNPVNYQETINHALDRALTSMVNDTNFRDAVCGGGKG